MSDGTVEDCYRGQKLRNHHLREKGKMTSSKRVYFERGEPALE